MTVTVALAGDTMLGREVARALATTPPEALVAPEVRAALGEADLVVLNLECCISERGRPWDAAGKPFFFRAPPRAVELLALLGTDCVTLANNHALDYGVAAAGRLVLADPLAAVANQDPGLSRGPKKVVVWSFPIVSQGQSSSSTSARVLVLRKITR
jgi:poly-gamma-glutamate capsule biosynthesis protein CapA/YwtB (metallophosphatase superfamily)